MLGQAFENKPGRVRGLIGLQCPQDAGQIYRETGRIVEVDECAQMRLYREQVVEFMRNSLGPAIITVHQCHHPEIAVDGDTATAVNYSLVMLRQGEKFVITQWYRERAWG